jgi:hypothetical protein
MHFSRRAFSGASKSMALTSAAVLLAVSGLLACGSDTPSNGGNSNTGGSRASGGSSGSGGTGAGGSASGGSTGSGGAASGGTGGGGSTGSGGSNADGGGQGGSTPGTGGSGTDATTETGSPGDTGGETSSGSNVSFFITSRTGDGNLGGLDGADKICQDLAVAAGFGGKTWKAYLSNDTPAVNAKDRIGTGPWYNVKGVKIADDVAGLHTTAGNTLTGPAGLTEKGVMVPISNPNQHDILTGSNADGTLAANKTCMNWTGMGVARVGHYNKAGGGQMPMSWNSAHDSAGCSAQQLVSTGGAGRFYCFATTP